MVPGVNVPREPPVNVEGPDQDPLVEGDPPSNENKFIADPFEQTLVELLVPELGAVFTVTVTVDEKTPEQGAVPFIV